MMDKRTLYGSHISCNRTLPGVQNELAILEFIHCLVETLDRYFSNVCELDLMFNLEMVRLPPAASQLHAWPGRAWGFRFVFHQLLLRLAHL